MRDVEGNKGMSKEGMETYQSHSEGQPSSDNNPQANEDETGGGSTGNS